MTEIISQPPALGAGILRARYRCTSRNETLHFYRCILTPAPFQQMDHIIDLCEFSHVEEKGKIRGILPEVGEYYLVARGDSVLTEFIKL